MEQLIDELKITPQFHTWFCEYKGEGFKKSILPGHLAGFKGSSFLPLTVVIKQEVQWKEPTTN